MLKFILIVLTTLFSVDLSAQEQVKGIVFEDANNNGVKERKEKDIPNVAVTNGL